MKVSLTWLQSFFDAELPPRDEVVEALTFHSSEVEEVTDSYLEVKVLPDRAGYMLCHRGIAYELGAILKRAVNDPLRMPVPTFEATNEIAIEIEDPTKCLRYMGALVRGVKVGPSPDWLREVLEAVGQRSINNVVDATNYVMLDLGQPLHAFDAANVYKKDGTHHIKVRGAHAGEKITALTGEEYTLPEGTLLITDGTTDTALGIAGVKGGKAAQITAATEDSKGTIDVIIESANFDGSLIRKTSQALKLWTDALQRYQNKPSPELAAYGMQAVLELITQIAGGTVAGVVDVYPESSKRELPKVSVMLSKINSVLGTNYTPAHVAGVFERMGFAYLNEGDNFTVTPPFERRDITIAEDLIEEVGRILGYENVPSEPLPPLEKPGDQTRYRALERIRDFMTEHEFTEISTQTFAVEGDIMLANPLDQTKPALRTTLLENMRNALAHAKTVAPRVLGPAKELRLFEIGSVFTKNGEHTSLVLGYEPLIGKKNPAVLDEMLDQLTDLLALTSDAIRREDTLAEISLAQVDFEKVAIVDGALYEPRPVHLGAYKPFSIYPFALRDIAVWTPAGTEEDDVQETIEKEAGELLARIDLFDRFEKKDADGNTERISYAFRLVFESPDRTLSDEDLNPLMKKVTAALNAREGFEVR